VRLAALVLAVGCYSPSLATDAGVNADSPAAGPHWKKQIVLHPADGIELVGFPVAIRLDDDPDLIARATVGGDDIWFTDAEGALLPFHVERFANGKLAAWVRVPLLVPELTIELHYGDETFTDRASGPIFDQRFAGVWHLAGSGFEDSAGQADGTASGDVDLDLALHGRGLVCDGNQFVSVGDVSDLEFGVSSFSYSVWVNVPALSATSQGEFDRPWYKGGTSATSAGYAFELGTGVWSAQLSDGDETVLLMMGENTTLLNDWHHLVTVVDRDAPLIAAYVDGAMTVSGPVGTLGSLDNAIPATISNGTFGFHGLIDEVRVYREPLTDSWIDTEHANLRSQTFRTVGPEEPVP
jgi:hypothetical protein